MTDLLTPSDQNLGERGPDQPDQDQRTFRAATLDEAVAAARVELGDEVELIEAHRVRRGGLGGFFATDLGVEIIAARRRPSTERAPSGPVTTEDGRSGGSALDRLIERADAVDRMTPLATTPAAPNDQQIGHPNVLGEHATVHRGVPAFTQFDDVLQAELAGAWADSDQTAAPRFDDPTLQLDAPASTPLVEPTEFHDTAPANAPVNAPAPVDIDDELVMSPAEFLFDDDPADEIAEIEEIEDRSVDTSESPTVELERPAEASSHAGDVSVQSETDSIEELDALLRGVGVDPSESVVGRSTQIVRQRDAVALPIQHAAALATSQLVESVIALGAQTAHTVTKVSISVTSSDGTTVSVSTDLAAGVNHV